MIKNTQYNHGFTLIELLIALLVLGVISLAATRSLNVVVQTRDRVAQETRQWQQVTFFFSRLENDVSQAVHRTVRLKEGKAAEWLGHEGLQNEEDGQLTFTRAGILDQGAEGLSPQRIAYRWENSTIWLLRSPALDAAPASKAVRYPLLENVREFKLRYLDSENVWQIKWPLAAGAATLPRALEVALTRSSGEKITRIFVLQ